MNGMSLSPTVRGKMRIVENPPPQRSDDAHFAAAQAPPAHWGLRRINCASTRPCPVGVVAPHYNLERLSYLLPVPGYRFVTVKRLPLHRLEKRGSFWSHTPLLLDRSLPLIHTWNLLPVNARRFVVSFELELPRYLGKPRAWQMSVGRRLLSSERSEER